MRLLLCITVVLATLNSSAQAPDDFSEQRQKKMMRIIKEQKVKKRIGWIFSTLPEAKNDSARSSEGEFDTQGHLVLETAYKDGKPYKVKSSKYTSRGLLVEYKAELLPEKTLDELMRYKYDSEDNQTEHVIYNKEGALSVKWSMEYDDKGGPIKKSIYDAATGHTKKHLYSNKYKKTSPKEIIHTAPEGKESRKVYSYDKEGRLISKEVFTGSKLPETSTTYEYDMNGHIAKEHAVKGETVIRTTTYEHNKQGKLIELVRTGSSESSDIARYSYYPNGLTKEITMLRIVKNVEEPGFRIVYRYEFY